MLPGCLLHEALLAFCSVTKLLTEELTEDFFCLVFPKVRSSWRRRCQEKGDTGRGEAIALEDTLWRPAPFNDPPVPTLPPQIMCRF